MKVLSISSLYPTPSMPNHGIFVHNRLNAMNSIDDVEVVVVNPLSYGFLHTFFDKYDGMKCVPNHYQRNTLNNIYPIKFFSVPGVFKSIESTMLDGKLSKLCDELAKKHGPFDVVDVHWTYPDLLPAIKVAEKLNIPICVTLRGMEAFYIAENDARTQEIVAQLKKVDAVISLSKEMATYANRVANTDSITSIITNGVDTDKFKFKEQSACRTELSLPSDQTILLGVGSLIERKGFHHVINALSDLAKQEPEKNYHYYILGSTGLEGNYEATLKNLTDKLGLTDRVHFVGKIDNSQLPTWYNACDIFCLSSSGEGSPNVLTEAISCGTPAVATDVGSVSDIMQRANSIGMIINHPACKRSASVLLPSNFAGAIKKISSTPEERKTRADALSVYTWRWCAEQVVDKFRTLTGK